MKHINRTRNLLLVPFCLLALFTLMQSQEVTCEQAFPSMGCHRGKCSDPDEALNCLLKYCVKFNGNIYDVDCWNGGIGPK